MKKLTTTSAKKSTSPVRLLAGRDSIAVQTNSVITEALFFCTRKAKKAYRDFLNGRSLDALSDEDLVDALILFDKWSAEAEHVEKQVLTGLTVAQSLARLPILN